MDMFVKFISTKPALSQFSGEVTGPVEAVQAVEFGGNVLITERLPKSVQFRFKHLVVSSQIQFGGCF